MIRTLLSTSVFIAISSTLMAQSPVRVQLVPYATGFNQITDVAHAGDERLFVTQQAGLIRIVMPNGSILPTPFLSLSVLSSGNEQGLLGLAFDPEYGTNGHFYVNYTFGSGTGSTRISRFTVSADPNVADPASEEILFTVQQPFTNHNGGDLDFGPDGYLYVGFGDGGSGNDPQNNAQTMSTVLGKMIRIDVHSASPYAVPPDNPFVSTPGVLPEIWASGLRNPWRFGFDQENGDLWIGDVGQNAWEEVDHWPAGDNSGPDFGWRCREGLVATPGVSQSGCGTAADYTSPVQVHVNNPATQWCSVIGGRVYRTDEYYRLVGRYIYTDYCYGRIFSLHPNGSGGWVSEQLTTSATSGLTVIAENSSGDLFAGSRNNGILYRIQDVCPMAQPVITQDGNELMATEGLGYVWYLNGEVILGATDQTIDIMANGDYHVVVNFGTNCELASEVGSYLWNGVMDRGTEVFSVHPNPARDRMVLDGLPAIVTRLAFMDMTGREVKAVSVSGNSRTLTLDVSDLASGQYLLVAMTFDGNQISSRPVNIDR